jgi:hypothetical protein
MYLQRLANNGDSVFCLISVAQLQTMKTMETHLQSQQLLKTHKTRYVKLHNIEALAVMLLQTHPTAVWLQINKDLISCTLLHNSSQT